MPTCRLLVSHCQANVWLVNEHCRCQEQEAASDGLNITSKNSGGKTYKECGIQLPNYTTPDTVSPMKILEGSSAVKASTDGRAGAYWAKEP